MLRALANGGNSFGNNEIHTCFRYSVSSFAWSLLLEVSKILAESLLQKASLGSLSAPEMGLSSLNMREISTSSSLAFYSFYVPSRKRIFNYRQETLSCYRTFIQRVMLRVSRLLFDAVLP